MQGVPERHVQTWWRERDIVKNPNCIGKHHPSPSRDKVTQKHTEVIMQKFV